MLVTRDTEKRDSGKIHGEVRKKKKYINKRTRGRERREKSEGEKSNENSVERKPSGSRIALHRQSAFVCQIFKSATHVSFIHPWRLAHLLSYLSPRRVFIQVRCVQVFIFIYVYIMYIYMYVCVCIYDFLNVLRGARLEIVDVCFDTDRYNTYFIRRIHFKHITSAERAKIHVAEEAQLSSSN